jgi:hypothetical protein
MTHSLKTGPIMTMRSVALLAGLALLGACKDSTGVPDLNNVSSSTIASGLNRSSVQLLTTGLLNQDRAGFSNSYIVFPETMARDVYRLDPAENRYIVELIGHPADPGGFVGGGIWTNYFVSIRAANNIIDNIKTATDLSPAEQSATVGLAQTIKALNYYRALESRDTVGIPVAVDQPLSAPPAPFVCKPSALAYISSLLDSAATNLSAGGVAFPFTLPSGFSLAGDYSTPSSFLAINRALKGKVELYRGLDHTKPNVASFGTAITALNAAIGTLDPTALKNGAYYVYSAAAGETTNPINDQNIHLNPAVGDSILPGDLRAAKILSGVGPFSASGVHSTYNMAYTVTSNPANLTRPMPLFKVAEMVLLRAQARIEAGDLVGATADLNVIHTNLGGLAPYPMFVSADSARSAALYEKRYTLLLEGPQRLVDLRAYSRLTATYFKKETAEDFFQAALPIPAGEINGRGGVQPTLTCN